MKHETRSAYVKKLREQYKDTPEQAEERRKNTQIQAASHKYKNSGNTRNTENVGR